MDPVKRGGDLILGGVQSIDFRLISLVRRYNELFPRNLLSVHFLANQWSKNSSCDFSISCHQ